MVTGQLYLEINKNWNVKLKTEFLAIIKANVALILDIADW